jgi:succinate dehydrogenase flavin-adding protein (antitoxin of CptAB toxin-antitoxin module)
MKINRILPHFFTTDIRDEEITQKYEKSFEEILREEQEKLMRLISEAENTENMEQFYHQQHPRMIDGLFFEE